MESAIREITIKLEIVDEPHVVQGFKPTDTAKDVKKKINETVETSVDGDILLGWLVVGPAHFLKDADTLASCCYDRSEEFPILEMRLFPCLDETVDVLKEGEDFRRDLGLCNQAWIELGGNAGTKRPESQLPTQATQVQDRLCIHGPLKLIDKYGIREIPLSQLMSAAEAKTTATVVLLAPTDTIFRKLCSLPEHITSKYLIVRVTWDLMSHYFVRLMRCSYDLELPLVAVTDLDPDHLDLFTFLDTPFCDLEQCYGWVVENPFDPDEISVLTLIEVVGIMWLGLRPTQCTNPLHTSNDYLASSADDGFYKVIRLLKVHPLVQTKPEWLSALEWLSKHGKRVSLHPCTSDCGICPTSLLEDEGFIVKKVSEEDWV